MPITKSFNSKANAKQATNQDLPFNQAQPVIARYPSVATAAQTVINLTFSQDTTATDAFFLFINGVKQYIGQDFKFSAIAADGSSSQITMTYPLMAGQAIEAYKMGLKAEKEFQTDNRFVANYDYLNQGFQGFVATNLTRTATSAAGAPAAGTFYSTIQNRAPIVDISQDLKASFGIERVMIQQIVQLQNEFGPNGEPVFSAVNDVGGLVRYVGGNWINGLGSYTIGPFVNSPASGDYAEVTFYGTALNMMVLYGASGGIAPVLTYSVDGATAQNISWATNASQILLGRNYTPNQIIGVVSGLTLGVHTVKIAQTSANSSNYWNCLGFEIINQSSTINVNPGSTYLAGQKQVLASAASVAYNTTFDSGSLGTVGGHVVVYQKSDGTIGKAVTPTGSPLYLTSASHSNEEVQRTYNFREFGAGRSDDFSNVTAASGSRAFTLDDGTTTLVTNGVDTSNEGIIPSATSNFITFTFVGTGLDFLNVRNVVTTSTYSILIDGVTVASGLTGASFGTTGNSNIKVASGLPYGTHTFKLICTTLSGAGVAIKNFIVYQPKKPAIPAGAIELADYNVMATFVANTTEGSSTVSTGVLRKVWTRENTLVGSITIATVDAGHLSGFGMRASTSGDYAEYVFFGTGLDLRFYDGVGGFAFTGTVTVDGSSNLAAFTTSVYGAAGTTFTASTGSLVAGGNGTYGAGLVINGLSLGLHKVRVTKTGGTIMVLDTYDIITPIYSAKSNLTYDLQNTLLVGSNALSDNRKTSPVKEASLFSKSVVQAIGVVNSPTTTAVALVPMPDMSVTIKTGAGFLDVFAYFTASNNIQINIQYAIYIDGVQAGPAVGPGIPANLLQANSIGGVFPITAGVHRVDIYWYTAGGTLTALDTRRLLRVREV